MRTPILLGIWVILSIMWFSPVFDLEPKPPKEECIDGIIYYRGQGFLTPKLIKVSEGTSGYSYEQCKEVE